MIEELYRYSWIEDGLRHSAYIPVQGGIIAHCDSLKSTPAIEWVGWTITQLDEARQKASWPLQFDSLKRVD